MRRSVLPLFLSLSVLGNMAFAAVWDYRFTNDLPKAVNNYAYSLPDFTYYSVSEGGIIPDPGGTLTSTQSRSFTDGDGKLPLNNKVGFSTYTYNGGKGQIQRFKCMYNSPATQLPFDFKATNLVKVGSCVQY